MPPERFRYQGEYLDNDLNRHRFFSRNNRSLTNISHKNSYGIGNWKNFQKTENLSLYNGSDERPCEMRRKLPLMRTGSFSSTGKRSAMRYRSRPSGSFVQAGNITRFVGMDCEMVGIGERGSISVLARVSIVNSHCECIYDKYVKPPAPVTDYRTFVSGIRPHHLKNGEDFFTVQSEVTHILDGRILVGHALKHDLEALVLTHPKNSIRDTSTCLKFRREARGGLSLKNLTYEFLNVNIQTGEHDSVEDARAAMQLYMTYRKEWENERQNERRRVQQNTVG